METHKKLIKLKTDQTHTIIVNQTQPQNPEKPYQTHTTVADQTQPRKPRKTQPHHHHQSS